MCRVNDLDLASVDILVLDWEKMDAGLMILGAYP
jgi:hypothetical protein